MYHTKIRVLKYIFLLVTLAGFTQLVANQIYTEKKQIAWDGYYGGHGGGHYHGARHYDTDAGFYRGPHGYDNMGHYQHHGDRYWENHGWENGLVYGQDLNEDDGVITIPSRGIATSYYYYPVLVNQPDYTYFYMTYPD